MHLFIIAEVYICEDQWNVVFFLQGALYNRSLIYIGLPKHLMWIRGQFWSICFAFQMLYINRLATSSDCPGTQIARGILSLHMARTTRNHTSSAHVRYVRNLRKSKSFQIYEHDSTCQSGLGKVFKTLDKTWVTQKGCQQVQAQRPQWHLKFLGLVWVDGFRMTVQALDWLWQ